MKLSDFMMFLKGKKKLFLIASAIAFVLMLLFTVFLNGIPYEVTATLKVDSSILLSVGTAQNQSDKTINRITLNTDRLDDRTAMEYVQSNKEFFNTAPMIDYNEIVTKLSDKEFIAKTLNSVGFKSFLREEKVLTNDEKISIVEQSDTLSVRVHGKNSDAVKTAYDKMLIAVPKYVSDTVVKKLTEVKTAVDAASLSDQQQADDVIKQYMELKAKTGFEKASDYNSGLELLNTLSSLSYNTNQNTSISNRIGNLLSNDISPDLSIKNEDLSGLKLATTLIPYVIIEIIAALLLGLLFIFVCELFKSAKSR